MEVHATTLFMFDPCCGSNFNFNGEPTSGPAWRELRQYYADLDGFDLTITDDVLN
ncbi:MAG: hypothetical protein HC859_08055 [Bacteroidia bacterium]|nr:hypothetical protein [Bacteroidia bacterium]